MREAQRRDVNEEPRSEVMCSGTPNLETYAERKAAAYEEGIASTIDVDMDMGESVIRLGKCANPEFNVAMDFGILAGETGMGPTLCILRDGMPCELRFEEGSCGMVRRMGEAVDKVEDSTAERARAARTCGAEDCGPVVVDGDVLPLKRGEGRPTGGHLRVLRLQAGKMVVVEAKKDR